MMRGVAARAYATTVPRAPRILVIGCLGQIGQELFPALQKRFGPVNVIGADVRKPFGNLKNEKIRFIDLSTPAALTDIVIGAFCARLRPLARCRACADQ